MNGNSTSPSHSQEVLIGLGLVAILVVGTLFFVGIGYGIMKFVDAMERRAAIKAMMFPIEVSGSPRMPSPRPEEDSVLLDSPHDGYGTTT